MFRNKLSIVLCCLVLIGSIHNISPIQATESINEKMKENQRIQSLFQKYVDDFEVVGASIGLIDQGIIKFFSYGKKSIDGDEVVSEDTLFEIGSITKVFTTIVLMDMVAKGEVQLDDPIELYLPAVKVPEMDGKKITLRHLATHYSGIPRLPDNFLPVNPANPYADVSVLNLYGYLSDCSLRAAPGQQFEYSNFGMSLLGHILSLKAGKSYEELISDRISAKLGMENTGVSLTPEMQKLFATGHHIGQTVGCWDFTQATAGCGGLRSNIKDMTQFLAANMGLLNSPLTDLLKECHKQQYAPIPKLGVGLGWMLSYPRSETKNIMHNGGTGGFRTYLGFNPTTQKGIVILSNSTEEWPDELGASVLD